MRRRQVFTVTRSGWLWRDTDPTPAALKKLLVEAFATQKALEICTDQGRRSF